MSAGIATFVRRRDVPGADQRLYKLEPPLIYRRDSYGRPITTEYVVVSATVMQPINRCETYIFAANEEGRIIDWCALSESQNHILDHAQVLRDAGYEVRQAPAAIKGDRL